MSSAQAPDHSVAADPTAATAGAVRPQPVRRKRTDQRGQALVEFIAISMAIVPLFLLMPLIAKYQDIAHTTQMASRYVAFEALASNGGMSSFKPVGQLAGETRRRFFSNADAPIKTNDTAGNFLANRNLFWLDPIGNSLISNFETDVTLTFGPGNSPDHTGAFTTTSDGTPFNTPPTGVADVMGLQAKGIYRANVRVALANIPSTANSVTKSYDEFTNINLAFTRHTSVAIDSWNAASPAVVESRINQPTLVPAGLLSPLAAVTNTAVTLVESPKCFPNCLGAQLGPKLGQLDVWRDVVPGDRLK